MLMYKNPLEVSACQRIRNYLSLVLALMLIKIIRNVLKTFFQSIGREGAGGAEWSRAAPSAGTSTMDRGSCLAPAPPCRLPPPIEMQMLPDFTFHGSFVFVSLLFLIGRSKW